MLLGSNVADPRVARHDARRHQAGFDVLRDAGLNSSAWPVECLGRGTVLQVGDGRHGGGEEAADADDEAVAGAGGEHLDAGRGLDMFGGEGGVMG